MKLRGGKASREWRARDWITEILNTSKYQLLEPLAMIKLH